MPLPTFPFLYGDSWDFSCLQASRIFIWHSHALYFSWTMRHNLLMSINCLPYQLFCRPKSIRPYILTFDTVISLFYNFCLLSATAQTASSLHLPSTIQLAPHKSCLVNLYLNLSLGLDPSLHILWPHQTF